MMNHIQLGLLLLTEILLNLIIIHLLLVQINGIESCKAVDDLSTKICVPSETINTNVKVYNVITRINEIKTLVKHISRDRKCKFNSTTCNSNQKQNTIIINANLSIKSIACVKKIIAEESCNPDTCVGI